MEACKWALQDWPAVVATLGAGRCCVLIRKGGIHEPGDGFDQVASRCALLPSRAHQAPERLRPDLPAELSSTGQMPAQLLVIRYWADICGCWWLTDRERCQQLADESPLSHGEIDRRFDQGDEAGVHVLALRVYALAQEVTEARGPQHGGCKSWLPLAAPLATADSLPIVPAPAWDRRFASIRELAGA